MPDRLRRYLMRGLQWYLFQAPCKGRHYRWDTVPRFIRKHPFGLGLFRTQGMQKPLRIHLIRQTGMSWMFNVITLANYLRGAGHFVDITCVEPGNETISRFAR